ncbi:hypothetical protein QYS48_33065 [Marivirga arenosa]|uniref:Uncharacterized protein n=1 Tax=Marivirga arenosa TaxID=3059076 RepID=A0AA51N5H0_9BACT|nr:hypothetical protein [Marivirga sp. ABR2-2]WMN06612.1 hypothetical protein QYS48_33065 [Marivirga sp. ABR2-2]
MINFDKNTLNRIRKITLHPIAVLIYGGIISYIFYLKSISSKEPYYSISSPILIANSTDQAKDLEILWKERKIDNVKGIKLVIWNNGRKYIDTHDLIESSPITLKNKGKVKILSIEQEDQSRIGIKFSSRINLEDSLNSATFNLLNDEALEYKDGAVFNIIYTDIKQEKWELKGRVKGVPKGFASKKISEIDTSSNMNSIYILGILLALIIIVRFIIFKIKNKTVVFRQWELVFISIIIFQVFYTFIKSTYYNVSLEWLFN